MLRGHAYRNYMVGMWHVTPLTESGATGPFDGWPLRRGFDRFYGFLDAETDQYVPSSSATTRILILRALVPTAII
jgi:arylsulfatase A-like enzyme